MSKVAIQGNASGTGTFTIAAPNSNTDRTLTLPDEAGTVLTSGGAIDVDASAPDDSLAIDASGNVGIGTTSPNGVLTLDKSTNTNADTMYILRGSGNSLPASIDTQTALLVQNRSDTFSTNISIIADDVGASTINFGDQSDENAGGINYLHDVDAMRFKTNGNTERMRITSSGQILINTTSEPSAPGDDGISLADTQGRAFFARSGAGTGGTVVVAYGSLGECQIRGDGDLNNTNGSYGTISDAREKENIVNANSQWDDVKALQIKNYNLIGFPDRTLLGVVAQDLEASGMSGLVVDSEEEYWAEGDDLPEGVSVGDVKKESRKTVKQSILYMKALKALQEAMERIETLEAKVTALEAN